MGQVSEKNIFLLGLHFPCIINLSPPFFYSFGVCCLDLLHALFFLPLSSSAALLSLVYRRPSGTGTSGTQGEDGAGDQWK